MKQLSEPDKGTSKAFWNNSGNALISVIFFGAVAIMVATAAIGIMTTTISISSTTQIGTEALSVAESGAENGVLRLLRDPSYTGEVLSVGSNQATIRVTGSNPYIITSVGVVNNEKRTIQVQVGYTNGILEIQSWKEM